jgi:hypothetical protein
MLNSGDTAWMITSSALVLLMTLGLATWVKRLAGLRTALKALIRTLRRAYDKDAGKYADRLRALLPAGR